jgi:hypothetical protein
VRAVDLNLGLALITFTKKVLNYMPTPVEARNFWFLGHIRKTHDVSFSDGAITTYIRKALKLILRKKP